jgi:hypothetical protein
MKLHLTESSAWIGLLYDLKIESGEVSFTGSHIYDGRFPSRFKLRNESNGQIEDGIHLLDIFHWRPIYQPEDVGSTVDDGGSWSLSAIVGDRTVASAGQNAFPSYRSASTTALHEERFGLLRTTVFAALQLSVPFGYSAAKQKAEQDGGGNSASLRASP